MKWHEAMQAYFGVTVPEVQRAGWWQELERSCAGITEFEVEDAIRDASFKERGKYSGKPTLKDLRMWVFMKRKKERTDDSTDGERTGCDECNCGWLDYRRTGGQYHGSGLSIPCLCGAGNGIAELFEVHDQKHYADMARMEMKRRREELPALLNLAKERPLGEAIRQMAQDMRTVNLAQ